LIQTVVLILFLSFMPRAVAEGVYLAKEVVVPEGQDHVDLPPFSLESPKIRTRIGYGIYFESWSSKSYLCRIHLNQGIEKLEKGTVIVFDGRYEVEKTVHGMYAHKFFVKEPKEIEYICCGAYLEFFRSLLGGNAIRTGKVFLEDYR